MKQIYEQGTLQMVRSQNNLVFVAKQDEHEGKTSIVYRMYDCGTGAVSPVTRSVFLLAKFGNIFEQFENDPNEFISCKAVILPDFRTLIVLKTEAPSFTERTAKSSGAATPFTRIRLLPPLPSPGTPFGRHIEIPRPLLPIPPKASSPPYPPYRG